MRVKLVVDPEHARETIYLIGPGNVALKTGVCSALLNLLPQQKMGGWMDFSDR